MFGNDPGARGLDLLVDQSDRAGRTDDDERYRADQNAEQGIAAPQPQILSEADAAGAEHRKAERNGRHVPHGEVKRQVIVGVCLPKDEPRQGSSERGQRGKRQHLEPAASRAVEPVEPLIEQHQDRVHGDQSQHQAEALGQRDEVAAG